MRAVSTRDKRRPEIGKSLRCAPSGRDVASAADLTEFDLRFFASGCKCILDK
jgi:hypothetical protein